MSFKTVCWDNKLVRYLIIFVVSFPYFMSAIFSFRPKPPPPSAEQIAATAKLDAAASAKSEADKVAQDVRDKESAQKKKAFDHAFYLLEKIKAGLLDPESAKIKYVTIDKSGDLLCVDLLAKNAYGGYTGLQTLAISYTKGRVKSKACGADQYIKNKYRFQSMEDAGMFGE